VARLKGIGAAALAMGLAPAALGGDQTFTSRVEAVRLDVLVTADGQPVKGLRAADFEVRDNGVLQQVNLISFEEIPLNVVFALDMSESITDDDLAHLRLAGGAVLEALKKGDRAGLVTFSHVVAQRSGLSEDFGAVQAAIERGRSAGYTALIDAGHAAMTLASSAGARGLVVMFSDGLDTSSWLSPELALQTARRSEVVVYGVAAGRVTEAFLHDLTDVTGGRLLKLQSTDRLRATFLQILEEFRHRYLLSYTPSGVAKDGWHRLQVRVTRRNASVRARAGYQVGH
jgi:VWFA-related protein